MLSNCDQKSLAKKLINLAKSNQSFAGQGFKDIGRKKIEKKWNFFEKGVDFALGSPYIGKCAVEGNTPRPTLRT